MPNQVTNGRIRILAILCIAVMAIFVLRLFYLQVFEHDKYVALARQEQEKRLVIPAERGEIYLMDDGKPYKVAMNQTVYTMFVDPSIATDIEGIKNATREIVGGNTVVDPGPGGTVVASDVEIRLIVVEFVPCPGDIRRPRLEVRRLDA